jgi:phenylacetyl-CoA:acceptor oxidoreductase subunit 2
VSYGPSPWRQTSWDWRAAANFICGGAGSGLIVFAALSLAPAALRSVLLLAGAALVGLGLFCVWLEIGRPTRALHVFFNPFRSWMTREACAATLLFPAALAAAAGIAGAGWVAAALALVFVYCQGRMLQASKGIPAWREPLVTPLIVATGLTEGGGLLLLAAGGFEDIGRAVWVSFCALIVARAILWRIWRDRLTGRIAPRALTAIDQAGSFLLVAGSAVPLAAIALAASTQGQASTIFQILAGVLAVVAGARFKFDLLGRAAFNQGFALTHLPVRGARR